MISFKKSTNVLRAVAAATLSVMCAALIAPVASAQTRDLSPSVVFTNSTAITVTTGAANNAVPYPSGITVSGVSGTIPATPGSVKVTLNNFSHTFPDDLGLVLVGPTGAALLLQDGAGDDPDMVNVTYTFSDDGASTLPDLTAWTAGTYKPTAYFTGDSFPAPGPGTVYGNPGPAGAGTATFASTFGGTNPNGTWNLYVRDFATGDGGGFAGGWSLEISSATPTATQHVLDYDGDGKTDRVLVRNIGGGANGQVRWFINRADGTTVASDWGLSNDYFVSGDFDGDQKSDIAVWRPLTNNQPSGNAYFYVLNSSNGTVTIEDFGQSGDDPTVVGDYNGDGKTDFAVYREGAASGDQSTWFFRTTPGGPINYQPWGSNGDFPVPGDYDGDGKNDFVVQRNNGGGQARFWMLQTTAGVDNSIVFGTPTDGVVPGDYDGDGKTDIATVRASGGTYLWFVRPSSTGVISAAPYAVFGSSASDYPAQGDYDGDGKTDVAVWRNTGVFWFLGSFSGAVGVPFGSSGDYPVANFNTH